MSTEEALSVLISKVLDATPEHVFKAWSTEEDLNTWFTTGAQVDFKVGGRYSNNDKDSGTFESILPNQLIRFTWENPIHAPGSYVEVNLEPEPTGCKLVLIHSGLTREEDAKGLDVGWTWALDSLESYLKTGKGIGYEVWEKERQSVLN